MHVEIGLPDEHGREQVLRIHTKSMRENSYIGDDVDLSELAVLTKNFSGAEIEALVKSAASHALNLEIDLNDLGRQIEVENIRICREHFLAAFQEIQPSFGIDESDL